jgi:hypothetical protein
MSLQELLDSLAKTPQVFVHPVSFTNVRDYLRGLTAGLELAGIEYTFDEYFEAAQSLAWDPKGNIGIERDFRRKGLLDELMIQELIAVEARAYSRALSRLKKLS